MYTLIKLSTAIILTAVLFYQSSNAQVSNSNIDVPHTMSYQGMLTSSDGKVMNGTHRITASLYSDQMGKNPIWQGDYNANVVNGIFTIYLGEGKSPLPDASALNRPLWVGIKVDGAEEMQPLTKLAGVPYALNIPDQSVTSAKLSPDLQLSMKGHIVNPQGVPDRIGLSDAGGTAFGPGAQGTTTTVLHGNNAGSPSYSSVNMANDVTGTLGTGNGGTGSTAGAWLLTGNASTSNGTNFVGTTDNIPFEIHVYNNDGTANRGSKRVMRYDATTGSPNILGGYQGNMITNINTIGAVIAGGGGNGSINEIRSMFSSIGGGSGNLIDSNSQNSAIVAGVGNKVLPGATHAYIGAGSNDRIDTGAVNSVITGGLINVIDDSCEYGFIGAGRNNLITGKSKFGTIVGGDSLIAAAYGQTVFGYYNNLQGSYSPVDSDDIFIIGNGSAGNRSNAFQVSRAGHSIVHHSNGDTHPVFTGGTYMDNVIYAWCYFDAGNIVSSFGVKSITGCRSDSGCMKVHLNLAKPDGTPYYLSDRDAAVVVSPYNNQGCVSAAADFLSNNGNTETTFTLSFTKTALNPPSVGHPDYYLTCEPDCNHDFMFMVVGRPSP